uniref:Uncharacterized protein n=1 Tax=Picea glauca TaxID=3330 RepID=A0A101LY19_PICGL|nr:hypothetical protein ABT39_MTgene5615 [Picea glauca]
MLRTRTNCPSLRRKGLPLPIFLPLSLMVERLRSSPLWSSDYVPLPYGRATTFLSLMVERLRSSPLWSSHLTYLKSLARR